MMADPEFVLPPIDQLAQAIHTVPPDFRAARAAIGALTEEVGANGADRAHIIEIAGHTAALCGEVAGIDGAGQAEIIEFDAHSARFGRIARALGGPAATAQVEPTDTGLKHMTGSKKQVHKAF
jgi:hypothetical protein